VMEQRAFVRFFTLKKLSARDVTPELEGEHGPDGFSLSAVKKWRKRFVTGRITLEDNPRSGRRPRSDLCESPWALIDEITLISCTCMCQKLWIPKTTCLCVLDEDLVFKNTI
jgi:hypothetical protein